MIQEVGRNQYLNGLSDVLSGPLQSLPRANGGLDQDPAVARALGNLSAQGELTALFHAPGRFMTRPDEHQAIIDANAQLLDDIAKAIGAPMYVVTMDEQITAENLFGGPARLSSYALIPAPIGQVMGGLRSVYGDLQQRPNNFPNWVRTRTGFVPDRYGPLATGGDTAIIAAPAQSLINTAATSVGAVARGGGGPARQFVDTLMFAVGASNVVDIQGTFRIARPDTQTTGSARQQPSAVSREGLVKTAGLAALGFVIWRMS